ncbi:MAG TPA: DUF1566 domain-containing protein [bacterium]|nr:DUF1566 domain-containing protein [bacterium]
MKKFLLLAVLIFISVSCSSKKSKLNDENSSDEDSGTGFDVENSDTDIPAEEEGEEPATDSDNDGKDDEKVEADNEESDPEFNDSDTQLCRFDQCEISGICYEDGEKESGHLCSVCDPQKERFSWSPLESGIICRISSGECDIAEKCDGSDFECPVDSFKPKDEPCGSQTESVCDKPDTCDGYGECRANLEPENTLCTDDGNMCNGAEKCDNSGSCVSSGPIVECDENEICDTGTGVCVCDADNSFFLSPDKTFCAFAGNNVPPTGQTKCYNATEEIPCPTFESGLPFFGADAQYTDNTAVLTVVGESPDRVVTDSLTGLTWELDIDSVNKSWTDAQNYCQNKGADWRLPTIKELTTTLNFNYSVPACDQDFCPGNSGWFWSSTIDSSDNTIVKNLYMYQGDIRTNAKTDTLSVRCVKGTVFNPSGVFVSNEDPSEPVSKDSMTGLSWTKSFGVATWQDALHGCEILNYGGFSDWRLPNYNEFHTVIDHSINDPASTLPNIFNSSHWTSTTYIDVQGSAFSFLFSSGRSSRTAKTTSIRYLCVR